MPTSAPELHSPLISFEDLDLDPELLEALEDEGYATPTPIQACAIPPALAGRDVLGCAQTGTGKTAAFALPILQRLSNETFARDPRALILTPTRELALQCDEFFRVYGRHLQLRLVAVVGGMPMGAQIRSLKRGCDVVVATPGRLLDLERQGALRLAHVEVAVLDEADRMLDMGFIPDIRRIFRFLPRKRQTLFFSATMPPEIAGLARDFLRDPVRVEVAPPATPVDKVRQVFILTDEPRKDALLRHLLQTGGWEQVLVFTRTKRAADLLTQSLERARESVAVIHGDLDQKVRLRALAAFKERRVRTLVATDVAARGLDIEEISHVVNYDMPDTVDDYIHRIGRTARASCEGDAVSLVSFKDWEVAEEIETTTGVKVVRRVEPGFEPEVGGWMADDAVEESERRPSRKRRMLGRRGRR